ncbi:hypothetical protein [Sphingomonas sp. 1185]|uniref:hypothetical protein n=1 Tax=Sphingomonas sp. 1185 TaxID=3156411 RepID=UPI0033909AF6
MEFLFEILIQYGGEILIQLLIETAAEIGLHSISETFSKPKNPVITTIGFALWGLAAGGLSLLLFPSSPITNPDWRRINVIVTPFVVGGVMAVIGSLRRRKGLSLIHLDRFGYAYVFALVMALVRFHWAG